jgi:hypothetical protein
VSTADGPPARGSYGAPMTFVWFIVWLVANNVGGHDPLVLDPVNAWVGTLILAVALAVNRPATFGRSGRERPRDAVEP